MYPLFGLNKTKQKTNPTLELKGDGIFFSNNHLNYLLIISSIESGATN